MKKIFNLVLVYLLISSNLFAQDSIAPSVGTWKRKFQTGVNANQASFSNNWKGGGVNSVSWSALLNFKADYTKGKIEWTNDFQSIYGSQKNEGFSPRKNADRVFFESKVSRKLNEAWRLFGAVTFMTQFADGYEYAKVKDSLGNETGAETTTLISAFFAPAYITEAVGIEYKPVTYFSAQFGVGALRQTIVADQRLYAARPTEDNSLYGVMKGETWRNQIVFQFVADFDKEIMKNVNLKARYLMIADYKEVTKHADQAFVHRLDVNLVAKVNRYINASVGGVVLYDYIQDKDVQYSEIVNVGILYTLQNYKEQ
jgi:hypothetical protein